jgi:S1-C subfamily serine protease
VAVTRADGEVALGRVAGTDAALDVAVIAVDTGAAQAVAWEPAALEQLAAGRPVFALADPGGRGLRTSFGLVTATGRSFRGPQGRRIRGSIEHSAPLPRGSSGGPLVDAGGRLLGINSVRMEGGLLLALPADAALRATVDALGRGELPARPRLGLALAPPRAARRCGPRSGSPSATGCSSAASSRAALRNVPGSSRAICWSPPAPGAARLRRSLRRARRGAGLDRAHGGARGRGAAGRNTLQFVKPCAKMRR